MKNLIYKLFGYRKTTLADMDEKKLEEVFKEGLNIPKIFGTIRTIGRRNYFAWFVLFILYLLVFY